VKTVVLFILGLAWAAVLVPAWLQRRLEKKPDDSIAEFQTQLSVLECRLEVVKSDPTGRSIPPSSARASRGLSGSPSMTLRQARRRRRVVLGGLFLVSMASVVPAVLLGGRFVPVSLACAVLFVGYGTILRQIQVRKVQRSKIRYLPRPVVPSAVAQPALLRGVGS
jgi:hypothetical protein